MTWWTSSWIEGGKMVDEKEANVRTSGKWEVKSILYLDCRSKWDIATSGREMERLQMTASRTRRMKKRGFSGMWRVSITFIIHSMTSYHRHHFCCVKFGKYNEKWNQIIDILPLSFVLYPPTCRVCRFIHLTPSSSRHLFSIQHPKLSHLFPLQLQAGCRHEKKFFISSKINQIIFFLHELTRQCCWVELFSSEENES